MPTPPQLPPPPATQTTVVRQTRWADTWWSPAPAPGWIAVGALAIGGLVVWIVFLLTSSPAVVASDASVVAPPTTHPVVTTTVASHVPTTTTTTPLPTITDPPAKAAPGQVSLIDFDHACRWAFPGQSDGAHTAETGGAIDCLTRQGGTVVGDFTDGTGHSLNDYCADPAHTEGIYLRQAITVEGGRWACA